MNYIVVTGASRGIGFEVSKRLAQGDNHIFALARTHESLKALAELYPDRITDVVCDLTNTKSIDDFISSLSSEIKIDALINNAGGLVHKPFLELTSHDWQQMIDVNLMSAVHLIKKLKIKLNKGSHILNIGSMAGFQGQKKFPGLSAYSASKGALSILSESLAAEFFDEHISVNCLCLGAVQTDMLEQAFPGYKAPLTAEEMAVFIADFALNGHTYFNGKVLPVSLYHPE